MPNIDPPRTPNVTAANVTPLPPMRLVDDYPLLLQVRRIGPKVQLRSELHTCAEVGPLVVSLPLIAPDVALHLAKALIESVTGSDFDLAPFCIKPE